MTIVDAAGVDASTLEFVDEGCVVIGAHRSETSMVYLGIEYVN